MLNRPLFGQVPLLAGLVAVPVSWVPVSHLLSRASCGVGLRRGQHWRRTSQGQEGGLRHDHSRAWPGLMPRGGRGCGGPKEGERTYLDDGTGELVRDNMMIALDCFSVRVWGTLGLSVHPRLGVGTGYPDSALFLGSWGPKPTCLLLTTFQNSPLVVPCTIRRV